MHYTIREIKENEIPLLNAFLYESIFIKEGEAAPPRSILRSPALQVYVAGFGTQKDDHCFVAEVNGSVIGAAWARIMDDYGHIDDKTPSLAISLYRDYRGAGIGTAMLQSLLDALKRNGYHQASLSVQKANFAVKLYRRAGFQTIRESEEEYIMAVRL